MKLKFDIRDANKVKDRLACLDRPMLGKIHWGDLPKDDPRVNAYILQGSVGNPVVWEIRMLSWGSLDADGHKLKYSVGKQGSSDFTDCVSVDQVMGIITKGDIQQND